jgi:hypothetical protein
VQPEVVSHAIYAALVAYSANYIFFLYTVVTSFADPDPDSTGSLEMTHKKSYKISCFEMLDVA